MMEVLRSFKMKRTVYRPKGMTSPKTSVLNALTLFYCILMLFQGGNFLIFLSVYLHVLRSRRRTAVCSSLVRISAIYDEDEILSEDTEARWRSCCGSGLESR